MLTANTSTQEETFPGGGEEHDEVVGAWVYLRGEAGGL